MAFINIKFHLLILFSKGMFWKTVKVENIEHRVGIRLVLELSGNPGCDDPIS